MRKQLDSAYSASGSERLAYNNQDFEYLSFDFAKKAEWPSQPKWWLLSEAETERKPYRYVRSFGSMAAIQQEAEMDKTLIDAYIKELLGVSGSKAANGHRRQ